MLAGSEYLLKVLVVDDSPDDARLAVEALHQLCVPPQVFVLEDGAEALAFLRREGAYAAAHRPHLILLDMNLPGKRGRDVLAEIKIDPALQFIPVIIMSSSAAERDVSECYGLHANCYLTKPLGADRHADILRKAAEFWLTIARLPGPHRPAAEI